MRTLQITSHTKHIISWILVALMACFIFYMSAKSGEQLDCGSGFFSTVKAWLSSTVAKWAGHDVDVSPIGHFTEFFLLGATLLNALHFHMPLRKSGLFAVGIASLYGITDEIHQIFVPMRACDPIDWIVDTCAALCAVLIILGIAYIKQYHQTSGIDLPTK